LVRLTLPSGIRRAVILQRQFIGSHIVWDKGLWSRGVHVERYGVKG
jgi:hypothetical protein